MPIYLKADDDMERLLAFTMDKDHRERLVEKGVRVAIVQAWAKTDEDGNPIGAALKAHGVPCAAKVRIVNQRDRVQGMADAEIVVDGDRWPRLSQAERIALLDHELTHIEPQVHEDTGLPKLDDSGRPRLKMRPHDYEFGWFVEVAQRHGDASPERQQARLILAENGQVLFAFMAAEQAEQPEEVTA